MDECRIFWCVQCSHFIAFHHNYKTAISTKNISKKKMKNRNDDVCVRVSISTLFSTYHLAHRMNNAAKQMAFHSILTTGCQSRYCRMRSYTSKSIIFSAVIWKQFSASTLETLQSQCLPTRRQHQIIIKLRMSKCFYFIFFPKIAFSQPPPSRPSTFLSLWAFAFVLLFSFAYVVERLLFVLLLKCFAGANMVRGSCRDDLVLSRGWERNRMGKDRNRLLHEKSLVGVFTSQQMIVSSDTMLHRPTTTAVNICSMDFSKLKRYTQRIANNWRKKIRNAKKCWRSESNKFSLNWCSTCANILCISLYSNLHQFLHRQVKWIQEFRPKKCTDQTSSVNHVSAQSSIASAMHSQLQKVKEKAFQLVVGVN